MKSMKSNDVKYVYHIADLHIRNLKRHKEYKEVFDKFLQEVKDNDLGDEAVIYLAGDIAHAKTEMSPELIKMISWFLSECSKLHHTFLITGNHDCNLNNNYRLDALSPIVENLNNNRIHYLKDTQVYDFKNLTFVVYSILDDKKNWPSADEVKGENKICLFHGPVNKAQTDIGYTVSSNSFTADMFDGFDMALLGDIHKRQNLGEGYEWVVYAGSFVQQNHGELLENHGYLLWDVESRTYTEHNIHNDYGFLTIDIKDGQVPEWVYDEVNTILPKFPKIRLRFTNTTATDVKLTITELKKLFDVSEVTVTRTDTLSQLKNNENINKNIVGNVRDETFQNKLIKEYLETQFLLEDDDLEEIGKINKEINSRIDDSKGSQNIVWYPKSFEFSNMFSYGESNKLRFNKANGIIGIFAPNASGKSSLFDALSFCIYDKTSRTYLAKNILNNRKSNFYCKFNFEINGIDFFVERKGKLINKGKNVKVDVNFWKEENGITTSLNGEQRRDTNHIIQQYLGTYEDFVLTSLSLQGNNALFIDKSQSERKDILAQFIGVDIFDKLYNEASEENRENRTLIKKFKRDDFTSKLADIELQYNKKQNEYKLLNTELKSAKSLTEDINKEILLLNNQLVNISTSVTDVDIAKSELEKYKTELSSYKDLINKTQNNIEKLEKNQIELEDILDEYDCDELKEKVERSNKLQNDLQNIQIEIEKRTYKLSSFNERKSHLDTHKYNENCEICMENSHTILEQKEKIVNDIKEINQSITELNNKESKLKHSIDELIEYKNQYSLYIETKEKEVKIDRDLNNLLTKISNYENKILDFTNKIENLDKEISQYYKNENIIKNNNKIKSSIKLKEGELNSNKKDVTNKENKLLSINGEVSSLKNQIENISDRIDEVKQLEEQNRLYEYYLNALNRDGVSYDLISKSLPMIEGEVNNILTQIVEFGMQLEMDGKNINAYIVYDDQRWSLEMCSGMERFISGLAIRIALINVCNLPRPNFLVIDEGFGTLDSENLTSLYMLFSYLKTQFDFVMIISHIDSMRDVVDNLIEIKKEEGFSSVKL